MPRLILHPNSPRMREFVLKEGANFLGRDAGNDVAIEDPSVSGSHAQIMVNGPSVTVTDLGSSNGTFIDREPIIEAQLQSGQLLRLGGVEMVFESDGEERVDPSVAEIQAEAPAANPVRLRVSASGQAAPIATPSLAAPGAPPLAPRIPVAAPLKTNPGKSVCRFHPKSPARWQCAQCGQSYCELCVTRRRTAEGQGAFCRPCGVECAPLAAPASLLPDPSDENFYSQLPGAFLYPFKSGVGFVLVCMAVFFAVVGFFAGFFRLAGLAVQVFALGYVFLYMQNIIQYTTQGEDREPPVPDVTNIIEDVIFPAFQLIGTMAVCFAPATCLAIWSMTGGPEWSMWAIFPALGLGCLYFPMAFLAMAMFDSIAAINPVLVVPAIKKIPLEYVIACLLLGMVFVVRVLGAIFLIRVIPIPVVPGFISDVIGLYFLAVQCRVLGLLYYTNRYELGWMRH